jgi:hypothetical protein
MSVSERYSLGALVYVPGTAVTSLPELHRKYGADPKLVWLPGFVNSCEIKESATGRKQKYITANWCYGNGDFKTKQLSLSVTRLFAPDGTRIPSDVRLIEESLLFRPPPKKKKKKNDGVEVEEEDGDMGVIPMSQLVELPSDAAFASLPSPTQGERPTKPLDCVELGIDWKEDDRAGDLPVNGPYNTRTWSMKDRLGNVYSAASDRVRRESRIDYFFLMYPPKALLHFKTCTNDVLREEGKTELTFEEMIKFFGIIVLATRFEFTARATLWSKARVSRFYALPAFGNTGMTRNRFDDLWKCMRFSHQATVRPVYMPHEVYRWQLVDDFVSLFNDHRQQQFTPADRICVDESISRWYGMGGDWINVGLPMYVAMDRKPENGAEIQNACCAESGVMIRLRIRKSKAVDSLDLDPSQGHGTGVLRDLVLPWAETGRIVVADSFFASVEAAQVLYRIGLRFVGVVKTATKRYPMASLNKVQMPTRGIWKGLIHRGNKEEGMPDMLAFTWNDTNRRFFITTVSSLQRSATPIDRPRKQQVDLQPNAEPEHVFQLIEQPKAAELYYTSAAKIDQHNRSRQDDLGIERKLVTTKWHKRVNLTIFSMILVDSYLVYKKCTTSTESPDQFYHKLAEELIDFEQTTRLQRAAVRESSEAMDVAAAAFAGHGLRQTPTKRMRPSLGAKTPGSSGKTPGSSGKKSTTQKHQAKCTVCGMKTTWTCSTCREEVGVYVYVCHTRSGRPACWSEHMHVEHNIS